MEGTLTFTCIKRDGGTEIETRCELRGVNIISKLHLAETLCKALDTSLEELNAIRFLMEAVKDEG